MFCLSFISLTRQPRQKKKDDVVTLILKNVTEDEAVSSLLYMIPMGLTRLCVIHKSFFLCDLSIVCYTIKRQRYGNSLCFLPQGESLIKGNWTSDIKYLSLRGQSDRFVPEKESGAGFQNLQHYNRRWAKSEERTVH